MNRAGVVGLMAKLLFLILVVALGSQLTPLHLFIASDPSPRVASANVTDVPEGTTGRSRGYLTTPQELREIKRKADQGIEPYASHVRQMLNHETLSAPDLWPMSDTIGGSPPCSDGSQTNSAGNRLPRGPRYLIDGSRLTYAKMLVAHLLGGERGQAYARDARARILELLDTQGWGGEVFSGSNQCILYLSWYIPSFVMAADLLEEFPAVWSSADKRAFQQWLADDIYYKVAWASRARTSNWGSAGSYAAAMLADYLWDSGLLLREKRPVAQELTPGQAYRAHVAEQLSRMSTVIAPRDRSDARCLPHKGIQVHGGIPEELRRARLENPLSMCGADHLPRIDGPYGSAYTYQMTHVEGLVALAELAWRRGDNRLYENMAADGSGSILRAIKFVIANPVKPSASYGWDEYRNAQLFVAYRYYRDPVLRGQLRSESLRSGEWVTYGALTHAFADGENPEPPPMVQPAP